MKQVWQSDDGKIFQTELECLNHEVSTMKIKQLAPILQSDLDWYYEDEIGSYIIERDDSQKIAEWIVDNFDKLKQIIEGDNNVTCMGKNF